jgi:transposase
VGKLVGGPKLAKAIARCEDVPGEHGRTQEGGRVNPRHRPKAERNERIIRSWIDGYPTREIAEQEEMTESAVTETLRRLRAERGDEAVPLGRRRNRELWPDIERLHHDGLTHAEIAAALGATHPDISEMISKMREAGIDLPLRRRSG